MSASNIHIVNDNADAIIAPVDNKKPRKQSLPAKFAKFIQFAFYLCNHINSTNPGAIDKDAFLQSIQLFAAVDDQQSFVQGFFDNAKGVNADIRSLLTARTRAAAKAAKDALKTPKIKKTKTNTTTTTDATTDATDATTDATKPAKKSKKSKKTPVVNDFVNDIVQLALGNDSSLDEAPLDHDIAHTANPPDNVVLEIIQNEPEPEPQPTTTTNATTNAMPAMIGGGGGGGGGEPVSLTDTKTKTKQPKEKVVKEPKEKLVKEKLVKEKIVKEPKEKQPKQPKEKLVKETKEKQPKQKKDKTPTPVLSDNDDDEAELEVEPFSLNGVEYLLDDRNNNLYDAISHSCIGTLSLDRLSIL